MIQTRTIQTTGLPSDQAAICVSLAKRYRHNRQGIEFDDAFQMAWIATEIARKEWDGRGDLGAWMYFYGRCRLIDIIRSTYGRTDISSGTYKGVWPDSLEQITPTSDVLEGDLIGPDLWWQHEQEEKESLEEVAKAIELATAGFEPRTRDLVVWRFLDWESLKECGRRIGRTESRASQLMTEVIPLLRCRLRKRLVG